MNKRISPTFADDTYEIIKNIAEKKNSTLSEVVRDLAVEGLKLQITEDNLDLITRIIRRELDAQLKLQVNRLASLSSKACIMSATSAFLSAEAISRFVEPYKQIDVQTAYDAAWVKAVKYVTGEENE